MTDKELLELAAKAARVEWDEYTLDCWNPLVADGDAFRLAVKLGLTPIIDTEWFDETEIDGFSVCEKHGDDPYAATRRAIVRAAAEIGKTM